MNRPRTLTYRRARDILLLAGLVVIGLVVVTMLIRGVDPIEVTATLMFAPVFMGFLFFGLGAGLALAAAAAGAYVALRWPSIRLVGLRPLSGLIVSRVIGYLAFGGVGGWAADQLQTAIDKLQLLDEIDDETGLGNARSVVNVGDSERARVSRYQKILSVVHAEFQLPEVSTRRRRALLRDLGTRLAGAMRSSDHVAHVSTSEGQRIVLLLPETGREGALTVADNLRKAIEGIIGSQTTTEVLTVPGDEAAFDRLLVDFKGLDAAVRP